MTLGIFLGLIISLYLLVAVPKRKLDKEVSVANAKLDAVMDCIDLSENQHTIDDRIANEIKELAKTDISLKVLRRKARQANILMAKFR